MWSSSRGAMPGPNTNDSGNRARKEGDSVIDKRLVLAALVMLTMVTIGASLAIIFTSPSDVVITRVGLIVAISAGPVGVCVAILQNNQIEQKVDTVQSAMNGHLSEHILPGHSDEQIADIVRKTIQEIK